MDISGHVIQQMRQWMHADSSIFGVMLLQSPVLKSSELPASKIEPAWVISVQGVFGVMRLLSILITVLYLLQGFSEDLEIALNHSGLRCKFLGKEGLHQRNKSFFFHDFGRLYDGGHHWHIGKRPR